MNLYLSWSRHAFRTLHGLPVEGRPKALPETEQKRWRSWARRNRVQGLLHAGLAEQGALFQSAAYGQAQHTLAFQKGPALAVQAWPDPGLRSFDDLDLICPRGSYARLLAGMEAAGYTPDITETRRRAHRWHYGWSMSFHHPDGFMVEANHRFFPPQYPWPCGLDITQESWMERVALDHSSIRAPTPAVHLLLCSMHAIWHGWARLAWLADIAGLLVRHPEALAQAQELAKPCPFTQQALVAGCGVAAAIFGQELIGDTLSPATAEIIRQAKALLDGTARQMGGGELRVFHEQFMTPREKTGYRTRRVCIPGDGDFLWISLPVALRGLYWGLRPTRFLLYGKTGY